MEIDCQSKPFIGVRFVLFGFDPINERQVRSKLIDGGGVDVGLYTQSCTHVIVDKIVFDDSVCVAARTDGKTLVTSLWVDHSLDIGMPVDAASIMYRPLKDLNGIHGANSLVMCLTGYQRQDREDIMTLVRLMGSQFSKPLVANKVTHLICYKFEGEKYELAKKIKSIKLVNHRWLEDCLRVWELLPEVNYDKSGYELETMEAEAKDSEEEIEVASLKQFGGRDVNKSPHNLNVGIINAHESPKSTLEGQGLLVGSTIPEASSGIDNATDMLSTPSRVSRSHQISGFDNVNITEVNGCHYTGASRDNSHEKTPNSAKVKSDLVPTSKNAEISYHSGSKFCSLNYSRKTPRKSILTMSSGKVDNDVLNIISSKVENAETRTVTACGEIPKRGGELCHEEESIVLPQKRMSNSTGAGSKSQKMSHNAAECNPRSPINYKTPVSETKSSACHSFETGNHLSPGSNGHYTIETATPSTAPNKKPLTPDLPSLKTVTSEALHSEGADRNALETCRGSKESTVASKTDNEDFGMGSVHLDGEAEDAQNLHQDLEGSSAKNRFLVMDKSPRPVNIDSPQVGKDKLIAKPIRKKMVAKKAFGSGHTTNRKGSIYSNKISSLSSPAVCLSREVERANQEKFSSTSELETDPPNLSDEATKEMETTLVAKCGDNSGDGIKTMDDETEAPDEKYEIEFEKMLNNEKSEGVQSIHKEDTMMKRVPGVGHEAHDSMVYGRDGITGKEVMNAEVGMTVSGKRFDLDESTSKMDGMKSKRKKRPSDKANGKVSADKETVESWDDEAEAADEKVGNVFEEALNDEKPEGVELIHKEDAELKRIPGAGHEAHDSVVCRHDENTGKEGINAQVRTTLSGEMFDLDESNSKRDGTKCKINRAKKRPSGKASLKTLSADKGTVESKKDVVGEENLNGEKNEECREKEKNVLLPRSKTRVITASASKVGSSDEVEKENRPVADEGQTSSPGVGKSILKSMKVSMKNKIGGNVNSNSIPLDKSLNKLKDEPIWFILSGHRLQRKEFQVVIRHLKGRLCRDSHQWSYQATHFIAPEIRRTEKFFAAAASGRWILKTDYLSACSQAGKFLPEEPYEWHKNGLSEDGAINLEAPRKWRLLRERTGHGAFHGMRIIVYGDCIAPPLDTLKRVVKAGDGNILATSPPYTRFLNSGVDFAVVSPGMPRVDLWVQEFLKHEIPCVVADYLVEFVCKPGYSLERHVQYNTHAWAEKSLSNLLSKAEEIVMDLTPPNDYDTDKITCQACGCSDRGEVMLICGDEGGSVGCGVGMHIDCCDPPLESVPEEDWFCPTCTRSRINPSKRTSS